MFRRENYFPSFSISLRLTAEKRKWELFILIHIQKYYFYKIVNTVWEFSLSVYESLLYNILKYYKLLTSEYVMD